jgi:trehalose 6-phosphate synthase
MGRLIVVSNRVPSAGRAADTGGLAVALKGALTSGGGLWFGWSGETAANDADLEAVKSRIDGNVAFSVVDLSEQDVREYYLGFANRALWPLLHYRADLMEIRQQDFDGYMRVNRRFARVLSRQVRADDLIWVHDYHLIPLAEELRRQGLRNRIGFFLHIPWPSPDVFSAMPRGRDLLTAFEAYDLVGFQTEQDAANFADCLTRTGRGEQLRNRIGAFPISIAAKEFAALAAEAAAHPIAQKLETSLRGRKLIIGVDRLDYTKGIDRRMESFGHFLEGTPSARGHVVYLQVTPKTRSEVPEYADMQRRIAEIAGRINGAFSDLDWMPIRYLNRTIRHEALAGLYRMAAVGLVTPLRDGMNLVAKEFIAAQDEEDPGVLVLSRFAGAASELDGALIVNPHDIEATAAAIAKAVAMPLDERRRRWRAMFDHLCRNDVVVWRERFLDEIAPSRAPRLKAAV